LAESRLSIIEKALILLESEYFRGMTSEEVARVAARTVEVHHDAGQPIDITTGLSMILHGSAEVRYNGVRVRSLGPGDGIGLGSALGVPERKGFSVYAVEHCHTLAMPAEDFLETMTEFPEVAIGLLRQLMRTILLLSQELEAVRSATPGSAPGAGEAPAPSAAAPSAGPTPGAGPSLNE
jgi:CRP-like cAMP-binding protein